MNTQSGRSMVEMLGVLAIIGVLSVGAIAGYSKAMMKYKLNKQAAQLNTVINAVARNIHGFDNLKGSDDANQYITSYFIKMGELPKEMIISGDNDRIYDIWKNKYFIALTPQWIAIYVFMNLDIKSTETLEMCRNILVTAKENSDNIRHVNLMSGFASDEQISEFFMGDRFCLSGSNCLRNITLDNIYSACTKHIGKQNAHLKITWDRKAN